MEQEFRHWLLSSWRQEVCGPAAAAPAPLLPWRRKWDAPGPLNHRIFLVVILPGWISQKHHSSLDSRSPLAAAFGLAFFPHDSAFRLRIGFHACYCSTAASKGQGEG